MIEQWSMTLSELLVTYWIHSSLLIGALFIAVKLNQVNFDLRGEWLVKSAMLTGIVTSLIVVLIGLPWKGVLDIRVAEDRLSPVVSSKPLDEITSRKDNSKGQLKSANKNASASLETSQPIAVQADSIASTNNINVERAAVVSFFDRSNFTVQKLSLWLSIFWLMGVMLIISRRLLQAIRLRNLLSDRQIVQHDLVQDTFNRLVRHAGFKRDIKLTQSARVSSPLVFSSNEVVVPQNFTSIFSDEQCQAALAHELAHLKRRDILWLKIGLAIEALFFIQPLNQLLNRYIHQLAEQGSDQLAAQWTGNPKALVEALSVAAHFTFQKNHKMHSSHSKMVFAMKSKKSHLLKRVENLLFTSKAETSRYSLAGGALLALMVLIAAPGFSIKVAQAKTENHRSSSHHTIDDDGRQRFNMTSYNDEIKFSVEADLSGNLTFNDEETAIVDFPKESHFKLVYEKDDLKRKLVIARASGEIEYTYFNNGEKTDYSQTAQDWFASVIPEILRISGLDAEARVARIIKKHGEAGVLDEVELVRGDYVRGLYLNFLIEQSKLSSRDLKRTIKLTTSIHSDFEQAKVLRSIVETQPMNSQDLWYDALEATKAVASDFEQSNTLKSFIPRLPQDTKVQKQFFAVAGDISSDFEMRGLLSEYIASELYTQENLLMLFRTAEKINSDFELSSLLISASDKIFSSQAVFSGYLNLAKSIGSDFEMSNAFKALLKVQLEKKYLTQMIQFASENIASDFELASLLVEIIETQKPNEELKQSLEEAASAIGSRHERSRVKQSLLQIAER